jgi:prolyl-tRNA synthetase
MIREFNLMEDTYKKIFSKLGLDFRVVEADSGAIGGSGSKEFHVLANSGEDTIVVCQSCEYGANIETIDSIDEAEFGELSYEELTQKSVSEVCPNCGGKLHFKKGIEVGHIFQLGSRYSEPLEATFLDNNGKSQPFQMATFGIGVSRLIASVIEQNHDDKGCIWTNSTAPFMVDVIVSNAKKEDELNAGLDIYNELKNSGIETIIDDRRDARFGFKMKDFELIGFPLQLLWAKAYKMVLLR